MPCSLCATYIPRNVSSYRGVFPVGNAADSHTPPRVNVRCNPTYSPFPTSGQILSALDTQRLQDRLRRVAPRPSAATARLKRAVFVSLSCRSGVAGRRSGTKAPLLLLLPLLPPSRLRLLLEIFHVIRARTHALRRDVMREMAVATATVTAVATTTTMMRPTTT